MGDVTNFVHYTICRSPDVKTEVPKGVPEAFEHLASKVPELESGGLGVQSCYFHDQLTAGGFIGRL